MTRVGIVTQARTGSTRLPGKVLLRAGGVTMLEHHLRRLATAGHPVIVATTESHADDPIVEVCSDASVPVHRGPEHDVLARFADCADRFDLDAVVRVTSDCPLIDGEVVRAGIEAYLAAGDERAYVTNTVVRTFPRGFDFEVFSSAALRTAEAEAVAASDREHVTPFIRRRAVELGTVVDRLCSSDRSGYRLTLDTPEDLELLVRLIEDHAAATLDCAGILRVLESHPELVALNAQVEQKTLPEEA